MAERIDLSASMLLDSGAFSDGSDGDAPFAFIRDDTEAADFFDLASDEEAEALLYDAGESAAARSSVVQAFGGAPTIEDMSGSIADDLARLNIGPPSLDSMPMSIVVQFWQETEEPAELEFLFEVDEMGVPRAAVTKFCTQLCDAPYRARTQIAAEPADEDESDDAESGDDDEDEDAVLDSAAQAAVVVDTVPDAWIPERGRVNVLAVLYAEAPVIVGLLTERYDVGAGQPQDSGSADAEAFDLDRLNEGGKRIRWLDGAAGGKRARLDEDGAGASTASATAARMTTAMHGFAANGNHEWTSAINRDALVCAFERDSVSGLLKEVRVAFALHALALRHSLQEMLMDTRNNI